MHLLWPIKNVNNDRWCLSDHKAPFLDFLQILNSVDSQIHQFPTWYPLNTFKTVLQSHSKACRSAREDLHNCDKKLWIPSPWIITPVIIEHTQTCVKHTVNRNKRKINVRIIEESLKVG